MEYVPSFKPHSGPRLRGDRKPATALPWLLGLAVLAQSSLASAVNFDRGRQLYENHCQACHSNLLHTREARKIERLSALQQRVAAWGIHAGQDWGPEEVNDVTLYLDRSFYRFGDLRR